MFAGAKYNCVLYGFAKYNRRFQYRQSIDDIVNLYPVSSMYRQSIDDIDDIILVKSYILFQIFWFFQNKFYFFWDPDFIISHIRRVLVWNKRNQNQFHTLYTIWKKFFKMKLRDMSYFYHRNLLFLNIKNMWNYCWFLFKTHQTISFLDIKTVSLQRTRPIQ